MKNNVSIMPSSTLMQLVKFTKYHREKKNNRWTGTVTVGLQDTWALIPALIHTSCLPSIKHHAHVHLTSVFPVQQQ